MSEVKAGQYWQENTKHGNDGRTARVVAVAEKHVMYRYKGHGMRLCGVKDFEKSHHRVHVAQQEPTP